VKNVARALLPAKPNQNSDSGLFQPHVIPTEAKRGTRCPPAPPTRQPSQP